MGQPSAELLEAVMDLSAKYGWSPQDILTTYSYETGGSMDPWKKGPTTQWGEHRGLIQWGEPQRKKYGITKDMSVRDQVMASGQYFLDRGVKPGDGLLPIYASINAGHASKIHATDENNGGAPGTVLDKVNDQMNDHRNNAGLWLDPNYVPSQYVGVPREGRGSDQTNAEWEMPGADGEVPEVPETFWEGIKSDAKEGATDIIGSVAKDGVYNLLGLGGDTEAPPPMARAPRPPPPMFRRSQRAPEPVVLVKRKEKKRK